MPTTDTCSFISFPLLSWWNSSDSSGVNHGAAPDEQGHRNELETGWTPTGNEGVNSHETTNRGEVVQPLQTARDLAAQ
jgi:hypothetical protein